MTTNGVNNAEEADMMECDGEKVVTMMDVLQEQQEFEDDANAVLGASDDKECTYSKGYIKRQALYACLTCCSGAKDNSSERAGVCLACSLNCHENHELIELYTKRNFRCDCGNPKFKSHPCQFTPNKTDLNEDNNYNQNFIGIYCICNRPYPDPEATIEEEMIQCIICEDWLHSTHLEATVPAPDLYSEMVCKNCMEKNEFLQDYSQIAVNFDADVDVTTYASKFMDLSVNETDNSKSLETLNETNNSPIPDVYMTDKNITGQKDSTFSNKENHSTSNQDIEIVSSVEHTTENLENPQTNELDSNLPTNNELTKCNGISVMDPDENNKPSDHILQDTTTKETENNETEPTINTQDPAKHISDDHKEQVNTNTEKNYDGLNQLTENVPNLKEIEQENIKTTNDKLTNSTDISEINNTDNLSKNGDLNELSDVSSATIEEKIKPAEENNLPEIAESKSAEAENSATEDSHKSTSDCPVDSLEAATKELSELMGEEENEQIGIDSEKDKPHELNTPTSEDSKTKEKGLNDEDMQNSTAPTDENIKVSDNIEKDNKRKLTDTNDVQNLVKKQKLDNIEQCLRSRDVKRTLRGAAFWPSNFRQKLCTCNNCLSMYKDLNVLFLTDTEDTVTAYEVLGKEINDGGPATQYEKGLQALSSLDRVQQINALTEYNKMRDKLLDFLKSFKERKEIVKEEDIKAFFAGMKPRREPDGVYFCR